jgi:hypothetical protein
MFGF